VRHGNGPSGPAFAGTALHVEGGVVCGFQDAHPTVGHKGDQDKPSDFNTMASFWSTLLRYELRKLPSRLHALAEVEIEAVPWKEHQGPDID
jgi:hypothetical protein